MDILGRGHSIHWAYGAGHIRLCMTNSEYSLSVREGSTGGSSGERWFKARSQRLLVTLG